MNCGRFRFLIQQRFDVEISPQDDHALLIHLETCESCQKFHHQVQQVILASEELPIPEELLPPKLEALARTVMEQLPQPKQGPMAKVMEVLEKLKGLMPQKNGNLPATTHSSPSRGGSSFPHVNRHGGGGASGGFAGGSGGYDTESPPRPKKYTEDDAEEAEANSSRLRALPRAFAQENMIDSREAQSSTRSLGEKFLGQPGAQLIDDQPLTLAESIRRKMSESKAKESSDMHEGGPIPQTAPIEGSDWMKPSGQHQRLPGSTGPQPAVQGGPSWASPSEATTGDSWSNPASAQPAAPGNDWKMFNQPAGGGGALPRQNTGSQPAPSGPRVEAWGGPTTPADQIADPWSTPIAKQQAAQPKSNDGWENAGANPNSTWGNQTPGGVGDAWAQPGSSVGNEGWSQPGAAGGSNGPGGWQSPPSSPSTPAPAPATTPSAFANPDFSQGAQPAAFNQPSTGPGQGDPEWGPPPQHGAWDGPVEEENFVRKPEPPSAVAPKPIMKMGVEDSPRPANQASPWQELKQSKTGFAAAQDPSAAQAPLPVSNTWAGQPSTPQWPSANNAPQSLPASPSPAANPVAGWDNASANGGGSNAWGGQNPQAPQAPAAQSWGAPQPAAQESNAWGGGYSAPAPQPITSPIAPPSNYASESLTNSQAGQIPQPGTTTGNKLAAAEILNKRPAWSLEAEQVETGTWKAFRPVEELGANSSSKIPVVNPNSGQNLAPPVPPPANDKDDWDLPIQEKLARQRAREAAAQGAPPVPPMPAPEPVQQYQQPQAPAPAQFSAPVEFAPPPAPAPMAPAPVAPTPYPAQPPAASMFPAAQTPAASMAPPSADANPWGAPKPTPAPQNNIPDADLWDLDGGAETASSSSLDQLGAAIGEQAAKIAPAQSFSPSDAWSGEGKGGGNGAGQLSNPATNPLAANSLAANPVASGNGQAQAAPQVPIAAPSTQPIAPSMASFGGANSSVNNLTASSWDLQVIQASEQLGQPSTSNSFGDASGFGGAATATPQPSSSYAPSAPLSPVQNSGMPRIGAVETKGAFEPSGEITSRFGDMTAPAPAAQAPAQAFSAPAPQPAFANPIPQPAPAPQSAFANPTPPPAPAPQPAPVAQQAPQPPAMPDRGPAGLFKLDDDAMDKLFKENLGVQERAAAAQAQAQAPAPSWPNNAPTSPASKPTAPAPQAPAPATPPWGQSSAAPVAPQSNAGAWPTAATPPAAQPVPPQTNASQSPYAAPPQPAAPAWPTQSSPQAPQPQQAPSTSWPTAAPAPSISGPVQASPQQWPSSNAPQQQAPAPSQSPWIQPAATAPPAPAPAAAPAPSNPGGYAAPAPAPQQQGSGLFSIDDSIIDRIFADNLGIKDGGAAKVPKVNVSEAVKQIATVAEQAQVPPPKIEGLGRLDSRPDTSEASSGRISSIGKFLLDGKDLEKIGKITSADLSDTTMRILTMEAAGELQSLLGHIGAHAGVVGSVIVGHDGLMIANTMPPDMDMPGEQLGVWALAVYMNTSNAARKLGNNKVYQLVSKTPKGYLIIADFGSGLLVTVTDQMDPERLVPLMRNITQLVAP